MLIEVIITIGIVSAAFYILYKNIKSSAAGKCSGCISNPKGNSGCSKCPMVSGIKNDNTKM